MPFNTFYLQMILFVLTNKTTLKGEFCKKPRNLSGFSKCKEQITLNKTVKLWIKLIKPSKNKTIKFSAGN